MRKLLFITLIVSCQFFKLNAQTISQNSGWFMLVNSTKFNDKFGLHFDFQLRSADSWDYVRNVLIRPGITYYINKTQNATLGYLYTSTFTQMAPIGAGTSYKNTLLENRVWEQYIINHKISSIFVQHRFRLEQRFVETQGDAIFAQRFRYFFRFIRPLQKKQETFKEGVFVALQNEVFLNIQNKHKLNGAIFDQNRFYLAAGYRFSSKIDLEVGYMNQSINGVSNNTSNNIAQLAIYTRF